MPKEALRAESEEVLAVALDHARKSLASASSRRTRWIANRGILGLDDQVPAGPACVRTSRLRPASQAADRCGGCSAGALRATRLRPAFFAA
jgi:hypothetical protein